MNVTYIIAIAFIIMGIVILSGKGDRFIAGYVTEPRKAREHYDIRRMRILIGTMLIIISPLTMLIKYVDTVLSNLILTVVVLALAAIILTLAGTWARK